MRGVHEHVGAHAERNFFLDMVVGLVSAAMRVEHIASSHHGSRRGPPRPTSDHPFDDFALGVISFSRRLLAHVDAAKIEPGAEAAAAEERIRDLLL